MDADGFLITDRKKDVILVKGVNILPREVEKVERPASRPAGSSNQISAEPPRFIPTQRCSRTGN